MKDLADEKAIHALFCGGSTPLVKRVEALPNAAYVGQLPQEKVLEYMTAADVLVLPSYAEGIPGVIKEAALCNLPVIATNVGGIPELIAEDTGWVIKPKSPGEIRKAILEVKNNYPVAMEKATRLKKLVTENFGVQQVVEQQTKLYASLVHNKK
jgi:teichuronic acid biosynthesis glycosyltransferase TuaC